MFSLFSMFSLFFKTEILTYLWFFFFFSFFVHVNLIHLEVVVFNFCILVFIFKPNLIGKVHRFKQV